MSNESAHGEYSIENSFQPKSLSGFKDFCKQNLLCDLREFETKRKQAFISVTISSLMFLIVLLLLVQPFLKLILASYTPDDEIFGLLDLGFYTITFSLSWYANFIIKVFIFSVYIIFNLILFSAWSLFYNSAFETFSNDFSNKTSEKIFQFINTQENLNLSNVSLEINIHKPLHYLQHSQILNGLFQPRNIRQYNYIYGYVNDIYVCLTKIDVQSGLNHYWTQFIDINVFANTSENLISSNGLILLLNVVTLFTPTILLIVLRLIKGVPYVLSQVIRGRNIDYQRFQVEVLNNQAYSNNIFKGIFFYAKFNKFTKVVTVIRPNILKANINSINHGHKQLIKLEDPEFSKYFRVYSEDQVDARYILSTSLMAKLANFRKKMRKNVYVSFVEDMMYIAVEHPDGLFEPNLYRSMLSFAPLCEYFEAIQLMLGLVEELNLDRQIWKSDDI